MSLKMNVWYFSSLFMQCFIAALSWWEMHPTYVSEIGTLEEEEGPPEMNGIVLEPSVTNLNDWKTPAGRNT